jgi:LysM domain-containing protein
MSKWRRRRKKRLAPTPTTGQPAAASPAQADDSREQPELPPTQAADDAAHTEPANPAAPADAAPELADVDAPPEAVAPSDAAAEDMPPAVVFELPEDSADAMPELHLPPPTVELLEGDASGEAPTTLEPIAELPEPAPATEWTADAAEQAHTAGSPNEQQDLPAPAAVEPIQATAEPPDSTVEIPPQAAPAQPMPAPARRTAFSRRPRIGAPGVELRADRVVHSPLAGPRRRSARDVQLDLEAAEREAASEALSAAGEEEDAGSGSAVSLEPVVPITGLAQAALSAGEIEAATKVAIEQLPGRSTRIETCPFLRSIAGGALQAPRDAVDGRNRCAAFGEPLPLSRMQQGLVCLQPAHSSCPRYVRGALLMQQRIVPTPEPARQLPVQVAAALLLLAVVLAAAYLLLGGRLEPEPGVGPGSSPTPSTSVWPSPEPAPTASPTASPTPTPTPKQTRAPTAPPSPLPAVYRGLQRCPSPQTCYVYVVRRGDTLEGIARRFDTTVPVLRRLNPQIRNDFLRVGQKVRVPPP